MSAAPAIRLNQHPARCRLCRHQVPTGAGELAKGPKGWEVCCVDAVACGARLMKRIRPRGRVVRDGFGRRM